jgi:hypothetical protein
VITRRHLLAATLALIGCAKPQLALHDPGDPRLVAKLGLSSDEWRQIQAEFQSHADVTGDCRILHWGRSTLTGDVEVWCFHAAPTSRRTSGPVFFFHRTDGQWHFLREEMSEWGRP